MSDLITDSAAAQCTAFKTHRPNRTFFKHTATCIAKRLATYCALRGGLQIPFRQVLQSGSDRTRTYDNHFRSTLSGNHWKRALNQLSFTPKARWVDSNHRHQVPLLITPPVRPIRQETLEAIL